MKETISEYDKLLVENKDNIISWYPFKNNSTILEVAIDEDVEFEINQQIKKITNIKEMSEDEEYDYIIIIGNIKKVKKELSKLLKILKNNGKFIVITDNKLSIKSMCQKVETSQLYNRKEIEEVLSKEGLHYQKYYYIFPNYKTANVIFTDNHLPDADTISRNITFYPDGTVISTPENQKMKDILEQDPNLFKIFSNSFFVECSKTEFEDNQIEFVSYSNIRKNNYKIKTIINGDKVYKTYANNESKDHIEQIKRNIDILKSIGLNTLDSYDNNTIISEYQRGDKTLDYIIVDKIINNQKEEAIELIKRFYDYLKQKLTKSDENSKNVFDKYNIEYQETNINNLTFIKDGLWDLTFQNTFYKDEKYYFYDQEWYEENIPVEYIMYRTIIYCKQLQDLLGLEEFYKIIGIKEENIIIFKKLDDILQSKTRSDVSWKVHSTNITTEDIQKTAHELEQEIKKISNDCLKLLNEKDARIKFLEENMENTCELLKQKEDLISRMENSTSWKITRPLRKLKGLKKGKTIEK